LSKLSVVFLQNISHIGAKMKDINLVVATVTERVIARSKETRTVYLSNLRRDFSQKPVRGELDCSNLAHGFAACSKSDKDTLRLMDASNIAIVTAYNDMLSAHQPYHDYPEKIKHALRQVGCTAQVAGGVPAMCDGITQGRPGMDLSLLSRDIIAQGTAIALSHQMFDGVLALGICDKIVPGLLIGILSFGYLPAIFLPSGPMESGLSNKKKREIRQLYAEGKVDRSQLLKAESESYHSRGTCTFYGTANSNQILLEALGLQLPGSSFFNPDSPMRDILTVEACQQLVRITAMGSDYRPIGIVVDEKSIVNAIVALLASGGSTNHTMHLVVIARAAGIIIDWNDISDLSLVIPLLAKIYPNGEADVNHFHAAGGTGFLFGELLRAGYLHPDATTVWGESFKDYCVEPKLKDGNLHWDKTPTKPFDRSVLSGVDQPFESEGGIRLLEGDFGRAIIKTSAVERRHQKIKAPAVVIERQEDLTTLFKLGRLDRDCVVVVRYQGPKALGMPELHKLTSILGVQQDKGYQVALMTDGRMSGASGKVPAAIHLVPEAADGGLLARICDGDVILLDALEGTLNIVGDIRAIMSRDPARPTWIDQRGCGRELFKVNRDNIGDAECGASFLF
jgi:phosphogluconate dehydratase